MSCSATPPIVSTAGFLFVSLVPANFQPGQQATLVFDWTAPSLADATSLFAACTGLTVTDRGVTTAIPGCTKVDPSSSLVLVPNGECLSFIANLGSIQQIYLVVPGTGGTVTSISDPSGLLDGSGLIGSSDGYVNLLGPGSTTATIVWTDSTGVGQTTTLKMVLTGSIPSGPPAPVTVTPPTTDGQVFGQLVQPGAQVTITLPAGYLWNAEPSALTGADNVSGASSPGLFSSDPYTFTYTGVDAYTTNISLSYSDSSLGGPISTTLQITLDPSR
jgi:hypothetical protein